MELRLLFVIYIDFCESKSSQKRVQSLVPDIVSFIRHESHGIGSCIGYRSSVAKMYQNLDKCFTESCCTNNERPWPCWCWYKTGNTKHWDFAYTMVKVPTGYCTLKVMISLSPLGLGARDVLIETVDAYCGWTF